MFNKKSLLLITALCIHAPCTHLMAAASTLQAEHPFLPNSMKYLKRYRAHPNPLAIAIACDDVDCIEIIAADPSCKEELERELHHIDERGETHLFRATRRRMQSRSAQKTMDTAAMCTLLQKLGINPSLSGFTAQQAGQYAAESYYPPPF